MFERLKSVLADLGSPPKRRGHDRTASAAVSQGGFTTLAFEECLFFFLIPLIAWHSGNIGHFCDDNAVMTRNAALDVVDLDRRRIFYRHGNDRQNRPVFYFIPRRFQAKRDDVHALLFSVLRV